MIISYKRFEKFVAFFSKVLVRDRPETIHDLRVASRRVQEIFRVFFRKRSTGKSRKLLRRLRNVRRVLGDCRNLDVMTSLVQQKIDKATNPVVRDAWGQFREYVLGKRATELSRARDELTRHEIVGFVELARTLLSSEKLPKNPKKILEQSVEKALTRWHEALAEVQENQAPEPLHGFRIASKRLRYRLELLADLDDDSAKARVKTLKALQDRLGQWHDRYVLCEFVAEFLGQADFLAKHPDTRRTLLVAVEKERRRNSAAIKDILLRAAKISWARPSAPLIKVERAARFPPPRGQHARADLQRLLRP